MAPVPSSSTCCNVGIPTPYGHAPAHAVRLALMLTAAIYALRVRVAPTRPRATVPRPAATTARSCCFCGRSAASCWLMPCLVLDTALQTGDEPTLVDWADAAGVALASRGQPMVRGCA
jgi:hypothetical protein